MAQTRLRDFEDDLNSFEHNIFNLGLHNPGRYAGFDTLDFTGLSNPLQFNLIHTESGVEYKDTSNATIGPLGVALSKQGTIIMEDDIVGPFTVVSNTGNSSRRFDLVIMEHNQIQLAPGQPSTYSVIQGPYASENPPALTNPFKQIILGILIIPANATDLTNAVFVKNSCPDSGDGKDARIEEKNLFQNYNGWNMATEVATAPAINFTDDFNTAGMLWKLNGKANAYKVLPTEVKNVDGIKLDGIVPQNGNLLSLIINSNVRLRSTDSFVATYGPQQYYPLKINKLMSANSMEAAPSVFINTFTPSGLEGEQWEAKFVFVDGAWLFSGLGGIILPPKPPANWVDITNDLILNATGTVITGGNLPNGLKMRYLKRNDAPVIDFQLYYCYLNKTVSGNIDLKLDLRPLGVVLEDVNCYQSTNWVIETGDGILPLIVQMNYTGLLGILHITGPLLNVGFAHLRGQMTLVAK